MNALKEIAIGLAIGGFLGVGMFTAAVMPPAQADPVVITQDQFPCNEDEVLGYDPKFGTEHVGCIHIDDVR